MPTSCGSEVLPLHAARGHAQAVPGTARDHQCRVRTLNHPGRGVHIHRQDRDNGQDTAQGAWGTEMYSLLGACKVLGKDPEKWLAHTLKHIGSTKPENLHRLLPEMWTE